jgi:hypothetical protein
MIKYFPCFMPLISYFTKVSVQGVVALATLCWEQIFFFIINLQKEKENDFTLLIILIVKSLQIELHSTNDPNLSE